MRSLNPYQSRTAIHKLLTGLIGLSLLCTVATEASHFRFGYLTWKPTEVSGQVQFNLTAGFRRDGYYGGSGVDGHPVTGDIITEDLGDTTFDFGDDSPMTSALQFRVTAYSITDNYIVTVALDSDSTNQGIVHTYSSVGPYIAGIATCCRIDALNNRIDGGYDLRTDVHPLATNSSPISTLIPILTVPVSSTANFFVPAWDPDGNAITWRVSGDDEAGGGSSPPNLSINPTTGLVTWDTTGLDTNNFWTVQIEIEDRDGVGAVKTRTPVDFLLKINPTVTSNTPPTIAITPQEAVTNLAGTPISFTVSATDPDTGDMITLNTGGVPSGAAMSSPLPVIGASSTNSTFNWTPTLAQRGTYLIIYSATDSYGSQTNASKQITIVAPLTISCPADKIVCNDTGACSAVVNFSPTVSGGCGGGNVVCSPPSGFGFPLGTNIVTCTATDDCGNTTNCSFQIIVKDCEPPTITCSSNIVAECGGTAGTPVFFATTATDICDTNVSVVCTPASGTLFPLGTNMVLCVATDASGNTNTCSFTVTVRDTTPPEITCSSNIVLECAGPTGTQGFFTTTATDVCATNVTVVSTPPSGSFFALGTNTVISVATDASGNTNTCSFTVTVRDTTPPEITCSSNIVLECAGPTGTQGFFTTTATDVCATNVTVVSTPPSGSFFALGTNTVISVATDASGNTNTCSFTVTVRDTTPPEITCSSNIVLECAGPAGTQGFFTTTATDVCATNVTVVSTPPSGSFFALGTNTVISVATDASGNTNTCSFTVTVRDTTPPEITCSSNIVLECAGPAGTQGFFTTTATDVCATNVTVVSTPLSGSFFALGTNTVISVATDASGNTNTCSFTVTVRDTTPPEITCSSNIVLECAGPPGTQGFFTTTATDVCATNVTVVSTPPSGSFFALGTNTVISVATDANGNTNACSFTVTVRDTTPPEITCSSNIVLECAGPAGTQGFFTTTATDVCATNVTVVSTPPSGSFFALGTNTVISVATDASGNTNTCSFTVTVRDTIRPQIICPTNMNVAEAPRDSGFATNVVFAAPIATDICDNSLLVYSTPPSGSTFPLGTNTVICTAVDGSGNTNTCEFSIRVIPYRLRVTVTSTADSGPGTLRQALLDANDSPDENLVIFNLPGPLPGTIHLLSPLPEITNPVIIDGWSQPGFAGSPLIDLDGSAASNAIDGLIIRAGNSTVRGLAWHGFATPIRLETEGGNIIQGNFIGIDRTGTNAPGNSGDGIFVNSSQNLIGGASPGLRNVVSGNSGNGIVLATSNAVGNVVEGNFIGVAADGLSPLGNGQNGVLLRNQSRLNVIGGTSNGGGNLIRFNGTNGITLAASAGSRNGLLGNIIFSNHNLGIDLGDDGVTLNDANDFDAGPNAYQNFPVLTDAQSIDGITTIYGELTTSANATYRLEFFLNDIADPSGYGEGQIFLGSTLVTVHGSGSETFSVAFPITATYTQFVTATATDAENNTSEFSQAVQVRTPPVLGAQPVSTNTVPGSSVTFCATATGTPPIQYQWRLNGVNISDATNACITIPAAEVTNGGSYTVIVGNILGALATIPASLTLPLPNNPGSDNFANRLNIQGLSGLAAGQNRNATFEVGEPFHAKKTGGKSVWYSWVAPVTGVATFRTLGSTFDTLMAIYTGTTLSNLVTIDSDEDHGPYYTSKTEFNAIKGTPYQIAIDGFGGDEGDYILEWSEEDTSHLLPRFRVQPQTQTVAPGSDVTFTAVAIRVCGHGHEDCPDPTHYPEGTLPGLTYQWLYYGSPIPGATSNSLTILNAQPVGKYTLRVSTLWQTIESDDAILQLNRTGFTVELVQAVDKFLDVGNPLFIGVTSASTFAGEHFGPFADAIVRGYTGTQVFNSVGSATSPSEVICGVIGGASEWISLVAEESGILHLNTDGSTYDTVMAVFRRSATNSSILQLVGCDNNSGTNGRTSSVSVPVMAGQTNYIDIDGVNGLTGILQFNYSLITPTVLRSAGVTPAGARRLQVIGHTDMSFAIQASTNLTTWTTLVSTNSASSVFDYTDNDSINIPRRYYRALLLP